MVLKLLPFILMGGFVYLNWKFSLRRNMRALSDGSTPFQPSESPALNQEITRLARALDLPHIPVHIHEIDTINGLAAPDGRIFITRGFLKRHLAGDVSAAELAGVVAHELGHVALGHAHKRMLAFFGQNALRTALALVLNRFLPGIGGWISGMVVSLVTARLSREDEYEADAWAAALLHKSGVGIGAQKDLFSKLEALSGHKGAAVPAWFLSHPKAAERIQALEKLEARWQ